ncbi:hypothetical protein [Streptomyces adustus]
MPADTAGRGVPVVVSIAWVRGDQGGIWSTSTFHALAISVT